MGNCLTSKPQEPPPPRQRRESLKEREQHNKTALTVFTPGTNPFLDFQVDLWIHIASYLKCEDLMNFKLASVGIPRCVTLNPALTNRLTLNLDKCPWYEWIWNRSLDYDHLARNWCRRSGIIDFPRDITNNELEIFLSKDYLGRSRRVSFGRCRKLTVEWFEMLEYMRHLDCIEVGLPPYITDEELADVIPYLQHATRLNCVGCSQLTNNGFKLLGHLRDLKELYFLHW